MIPKTVTRDNLELEIPFAMNFQIRTYRRFSMQCPVFYLNERFIAQGVVWNFSRRGWRIDGEHDVEEGTVVALCVFLPDDQIPVTIERAVVRWSRGQEFGLETLYMRPEQHARFRRFVRGLARSLAS